mgnify:CR=1 FL=1
MFDSVEHEGTLRVLISTPTLDAATISSSWRRSSGVRDQGQIMTLTGTGSAPGSPFQTQTRPLAQTQDSASDPEQIPRGGMALNVSLPVVLKGSPGSSCACSPSSKRAGRGRDQQKSSSQSVHSLAQSQSERELAVCRRRLVHPSPRRRFSHLHFPIVKHWNYLPPRRNSRCRYRNKSLCRCDC